MNKVILTILTDLKDRIIDKYLPIEFSDEIDFEKKLSNNYSRGQRDTISEILKMIDELINELEVGGSNE